MSRFLLIESEKKLQIRLILNLWVWKEKQNPEDWSLCVTTRSSMLSVSASFSSTSLISMLSDLVVVETQALQIYWPTKAKIGDTKTWSYEYVRTIPKIHTYAHMINITTWILKKRRYIFILWELNRLPSCIIQNNEQPLISNQILCTITILWSAKHISLTTISQLIETDINLNSQAYQTFFFSCHWLLFQKATMPRNQTSFLNLHFTILHWIISYTWQAKLSCCSN